MIDQVEKSLQKLYHYCKNQNWVGYDPYDALNSPGFKNLSNKWIRIALTQIIRRLPFNLRYFFKIKKSSNPKALALFIRSLIKLSSFNDLDDYRNELYKLSDRLLDLKSPEVLSSNFIAWGYNFPWQSSAFFCESLSPNIQSTIMGGHAFFEMSKNLALPIEMKQMCQDVCIRASRYILNNFLLFEDEKTAVLRYINNNNYAVINIQAQAAWNFLRAFLISKDERFIEVSKKLIKFVEEKQREDGSWPYAETPRGRFIDNFHTGFILEALHECQMICGSNETVESIKKGFCFYLDHFFRREGLASQFHNAIYPVDSHSIAQSIITLSKLSQYDEHATKILENILHWTIDNFQAKNGHFYYQKWPFFINKIPYMRWTQAWMLFALATFLDMRKKDRCVG